MIDVPEASSSTAVGLLGAAREYAVQLAERAAEFDRTQSLPMDVIESLAVHGFLGAMIPPEWGGSGVTPAIYGELTEIIGKACTSTRTLLTVHSSLVAQTLLDLGSRAIKEKYLRDLATGRRIACFALSEDATGSDAAGVRTRYTRSGDGFVLDGGKKWISFAAVADVFLIFASENETVSAFLVERSMPGVTIRPMSGMMGNRATHMAEIILDGVELPRENVVASVGAGFSFVANTALTHGRYSIAWGGVAIAQAALEQMCQYAVTRRQFGAPIGASQLVRKLIGDVFTEVNAARELCRRAGELLAHRHVDAVHATNMAKYFSSVVAERAASSAVQVFGANGCWEGYPVERLYREAKILQIIEGTNEMQQMLLADHALKTFSAGPTPTPTDFTRSRGFSGTSR